MDADPRLTATWRVVECNDGFRENCPCMIVTGMGDDIQYVADTAIPEVAARIVADHNEVIALREQLTRMGLAWTSARERAAAYGEGILRVVADRELWQGWTRTAEAEVVRLQSLLAERDEQIAGLLADEVDLSDDQAGVPA
ncbi:hypothetical protein ABZY44_21820 [Streptomyces sp. NPDC006544]|uniref:hypothetical protein n=1 Tax=Streptomyces sp. NPDC006544 TaxID=3154583 RepID=UPI0033BE1807